MTEPRTFFLAAALLAGGLLLPLRPAPQDPPPPAPSAQEGQEPGEGPGTRPLPGRSPHLPPPYLPRRDDLYQRFGQPSPLEGVWKLVNIHRAQVHGQRDVRGFVVFTRTYLSLHLYEGSAETQFPRIQSSMRRYRVQGQELLTSVEIGFRNAPDGELLLEGAGLMERRRFTMQGPVLRIYQPDQVTYLELRRVE